jgi:hypothetical protein
MEIEKFSVRELTVEEQLQINGGGTLAEFFQKVWDGIKEAAKWLWENLKITIELDLGPMDVDLSNR